ncbi:MAG: Ku protein [Cytophagaceae bacterium]|nr:Ku protein [Cytophagaceae bacterium]
MRAIWSGAISFGLVNIPVRLYSAAGEAGISFDMLAKDDLSPIKYQRIAASDGREVPYKDIVKGYEIEKGKYVVLSDKDFEKANAKKTKSIEILNFVDEEEINSIYFDKPYYLEPDKNASKPYALLREALKKSKKVGIASFVLRNREHLAVLKVAGNVIVLNQMRYHADVRDADDLNLPEKDAVSAKETEMAIKLIEQLTEKFQPSHYKDTYVDELKKIIEAKSEGKTIQVKGGEAPEPTRVKDLMDVLKASLETNKKTKDRPAVKKEHKTKSTKRKAKS